MAAAKKSSSKGSKGGGKRTPPRPKSTKNMPAGLKKYWQGKGVK